MLYAHLCDGAGGDISFGFVCFQEASGPLRGKRKEGRGGGISHSISMTRQGTHAHTHQKNV